MGETINKHKLSSINVFSNNFVKLKQDTELTERHTLNIKASLYFQLKCQSNHENGSACNGLIIMM